DLEEDAFQVAQRSVLISPSVSPGQEGWGYLFNFSVTVDDDDSGDTVNVSLWYSNSTSGPWNYINYTNCTDCTSPTQKSFFHRFGCQDYLDGPAIYYKFISNDSYGVVNETQQQSMTLETDSIAFPVFVGSGDSVNRGSTMLLAGMVNDTDFGQPVGSDVNTSFEITYDTTNYWVKLFNATNSSGYTNYYFEPNCSYSADSQYWVINMEDQCYASVTSNTQTLDIAGWLFNNLTEPLNGSSFNVTEQVNLNMTLTSDCASENLISGANVEFYLRNNVTLELFYCGQGEENNYYNCTWNSTGKPEGGYDVNITSSKNYYNTNNTIYYNWFWLENKQPSYNNLNVTPEISGWGSNYTFSVNVTDSELDEINCSLFVNTTGEYIYKGMDTVTAPDVCQVNISDFNCNDIGNASFLFQIDDGTGSNIFNTSVFYGPNMTKDTPELFYFSGNNSYVNRAGSDYVSLILTVYDTDMQKNVSGVNVTFWTTYNQNGLFENKTNSNSTGQAVYNFNPNCSYNIGNQTWLGGIIDSCYFEVNTTSNFTVSVVGSLSNNINIPNGEEYLRGENNVTINATVLDDCNNAVSDATVNFTVFKGGTEFYCDSITNLGNGNYSCEFNTTGMDTQWWNITMFSNRTGHNNGEKLKEDAFWVETKPVLDNPNVTPKTGGWGETFTFTVNLTDEDYDWMTVRYWIKKQGGNWQSPESQQKQGINQTAQFVKNDFSTGDMGNWTVKFNVTEDDSWTDETSSINFTVEKDDVEIYYLEGNNTSVNRVSGSVVFKMNATDSDKATQTISFQPAGFWITTDGSNWGPLESTATDGVGNFTINFDPGCTYGVGVQEWKGGLRDNNYWKSTNYTGLLKVNITSEFDANITKPISQIFLKGVDDVNISGYLNDLAGCGGVAGASANFTVVNQSYLCQGADQSDGFYNCSIASTVHATWPSYGWYYVEMNASRDFYPNDNDYQQESFYLADEPVLSNQQVSPGSGFWGTEFAFNVTLTDLDEDNVTVVLWLKPSGGDWTQINSYQFNGSTPGQGTKVGFFWNSTYEYVGSPEYKFNATDTSGYFDEQYGGSFSINPRGVLIIEQEGDEEVVNRVGSDSQLLSVRVRDQFTSDWVGAGINGTFWIENKTGLFIYDTQTDSGGYLNYTFNPNCSYNVSEITWKSGVYNDARYVDSNSTNTVNITGQQYFDLDSPDYQEQFPSGNMVPLRFNISTDCTSEGLINDVSPTIEIRSPSGSWEDCTPVENEGDGYYNCSWNSTDKQSGFWDIRFNSSKYNFNDNSTVWNDWFEVLNVGPAFNSVQVTPSTAGWGNNYTYSVNISDPEGDNVNCTLFINTSASWVYRGYYFLSGGNGFCNISLWDFGCSDIHNDSYFIWQLDDFHNVINVTTQGPNITKDTLTISHVFGDDEDIDREGDVLNLEVFVNDTDKNQGVSSPDLAVYFNVTTNGTDYKEEGNNQTSNGNVVFYFDPGNDYEVGHQNWFAYGGDSCYFDANTTEFDLYVWGTLYPEFVKPINNVTLKGNNVTLEINLTNDRSENTTDADVNLSYVQGSPVQCVPVINYSDGYYNCSLNTSSLSAGWYDFWANISKSYYHDKNPIESNSFFVETIPDIFNEKLNSSDEDSDTGPDGGFSETFNFTIDVSDEDND
ncbi:MAG: hypothetical protein DRO89_05290, partial [Candidatus Altiarchaeales archaeon]